MIDQSRKREEGTPGVIVILDHNIQDKTIHRPDSAVYTVNSIVYRGGIEGGDGG